jgi:hypothetical protein
VRWRRSHSAADSESRQARDARPTSRTIARPAPEKRSRVLRQIRRAALRGFVKPNILIDEISQ